MPKITKDCSEYPKFTKACRELAKTQNQSYKLNLMNFKIGPKCPKTWFGFWKARLKATWRVTFHSAVAVGFDQKF